MTSTNTENKELGWIRVCAALAMLIGMAGLIALLSEGAKAQTPPPPPARGGFQPGSRTFSNPFANPGGGGKNNFFDDEDDDELDFPPPIPAGGDTSAPGGFPPPSSSPGGKGPSAPTVSGNQISVGGTTAGGVISHTQVKAITVDDDTGDGSKEVVTDFNFPDADILDIAKTLGKLTGKNFILDKDVKGRITIISNSQISVGDAWRAFLTALDINGFALIPSGRYIRIARARDARDKQLKAYTGDFAPDTDALITRVFPLKYISAEEVARTFRSFMPANSRVIPYEQTNTVIVTDTGSNIAKLAKMLEILDIEGYDAGIEVIPVKYASAAELSKLIDTLLPGTGAGTGAPGGAPRFGGGGKFSSRRTKEGGIINTIISDERTNTLIVHANSKGADQVRELVAKLDQKLTSNAGAGGKVHVVYLQFAEAEQIANTLNNLSQSSANRPASGGGGTGVNPVSQSLFESAIKVSPDKATNSLVITASPADFVTVQRVINRLDIPRDEVYVEVVIMEVSLGRDFNFSANVINPSSGIAFLTNGDLFKSIADPTGLSGAVIGFQSGNPRTLTVGTTSVQVSSIQGLIRAIQTNSNSNVLATPQIIALDNTEASFESAEKIPFPVTTAVQGAVSTSISKENVSLSIKIKPQINKISNFVKLDIDTKLEDVSGRAVPAAVANLALATLSRSAKTTVVVGDSDTVVLGGLIRDKISETVNKIPLLGDIPLIGWLFKSKENHSEKTNLMIFLTPHIIRQYEKIRAILDKKLKERDDFMEENAGGNDPLRRERDEMIRNLPDIKELAKRKIDNAVSIDGEDKPAAVPVEPKNPFTGSDGKKGAGKPSGANDNGADTQGSQGGAPVVPQQGMPAEIPGGSSAGGLEPLPAPPPQTGD